MLSRIVISILAATSTCSIICGSGCDPLNPMDEACGVPMGLFGPCVAGQCSTGLSCLVTRSGHSCVPHVDNSQDEWSWSACAAEVGHALACFEDDAFCVASCDSDYDCDSATCDADTGTCVHPWD